jgi:RluA family pseudouridine synthase
LPYDAQGMVLWKDSQLLVVNKPAGLLSLPDGYDPQKPHLRSVLESSYGRLWIVHRLDRECSGVLVLARTAEVHRALNAQFEHRQIVKVYNALVAGDPPWNERVMKLKLRADGDRRHRTIVDARRGKSAETSCRVLRRFRECALLEATPKTGRPHQIRAHLAAKGHPVVGDPLYGNRDHPAHTIMDRLGLHAQALTLEHPGSGEPQRFEAPPPLDLQEVLEALETSDLSTSDQD